MGQYRLSARFMVQVRKKVLLNLIPIGLGTVGIEIFIRQDDDRHLELLILLLAVVLGTAFYMLVRMQRRVLQSYLLTIEPQGVRRQEHDAPDTAIGAADIEKIVERPGSGMVIHGPAKWIIAVPATLEGYAQARTELAVLHPIQMLPASQWLRKAMDLLLLTTVVGTLSGLHVSQNAYFISIAGTALAAALIVTIVSTQRNPNVERKMKRLSWFCLLPVVDIVHRVVIAIGQLR